MTHSIYTINNTLTSVDTNKHASYIKTCFVHTLIPVNAREGRRETMEGERGVWKRERDRKRERGRERGGVWKTYREIFSSEFCL